MAMQTGGGLGQVKWNLGRTLLLRLRRMQDSNWKDTYLLQLQTCRTEMVNRESDDDKDCEIEANVSSREMSL